MPTINEWFDKVICVNLVRRTDRWAGVLEECQKHGLELERFDGLDMPRDENRGCTESHGAVLRMIVENGWRKTLILEDDFKFRYEDSQERFSKMVEELPSDWFFFYLSGHYAEKPKRQVSEHIVEMNRMKTTTSYGVTLEAATEMAPFIQGADPIDELYGQWHDRGRCYIFTPRIIFQREGFSDLQQSVQAYEGCMTDATYFP